MPRYAQGQVIRATSVGPTFVLYFGPMTELADVAVHAQRYHMPNLCRTGDSANAACIPHTYVRPMCRPTGLRSWTGRICQRGLVLRGNTKPALHAVEYDTRWPRP